MSRYLLNSVDGSVTTVLADDDATFLALESELDGDAGYRVYTELRPDDPRVTPTTIATQIGVQTTDATPTPVTLWTFQDGSPVYNRSGLLNVRCAARRVDDGYGATAVFELYNGGSPALPGAVVGGVAQAQPALYTASPAIGDVVQATGGFDPSLPVAVVTGVNDEFVWAGLNGLDAPETFTVAAGTYTTTADLATAMNAATGSRSSEAFSTRCLTSDDGSGGLAYTAVDDLGGVGNGDSVYSSDTNDVMATIFGATVNPGELPLGNGVGMVVGASTSNQFVWAGGGGLGTPETFTVAAGTYTDYASVAAALSAATGSVSGEAFSTRCDVTTPDGTTLVFVAVDDIGAASNGDTVYDPSPNAGVSILQQLFGPDTYGPGELQLADGTDTDVYYVSGNGAPVFELVAVVVPTPLTSFDGSAPTVVNGPQSGNTIVATVTGADGETINWEFTVELDEVAG